VEIPDPEWKLLYSRSNNQCAFPGCAAELMVTAPDGTARTIGQRAHIVGESRQGPRGDSPLDVRERSLASNLVLMCPEHHVLPDTLPEVYTVAVLQAMKETHERSNGFPPCPPVLVTETLHSTALPVAELPAFVYASDLADGLSEETDVWPAMDWSHGEGRQHPFIVREGRLYTTTDLRRRDPQPFHRVRRGRVAVLKASDMWTDDEGARRYMQLIRKALRRHLTHRLGLEYNREHDRFWFPPDTDGAERSVTYQSAAGKSQTRRVAWEQRNRVTGEGRGVWWHDAVSLRVEHLGTRQWCVTVRPEFYLTTDGRTPMDSDKIGKNVTWKKSTMYNWQYLTEVQFWRHYLSGGKPRFIIRLDRQAIVVDTTLLTVEVTAPHITASDDAKEFLTQEFEENLFTMGELLSLVEDGDGDWLDDPDEEEL